MVDSKDSPTVRIPAARCRRAAECNRFGNGMYNDKEDCLDQEKTAVLPVARSCRDGIDKARLDKCIDALENQDCGGHMGPVTAMPDCAAYCARDQTSAER